MSDPLRTLSKERAARWKPPAAPRSLTEFSGSMLVPDGEAAGSRLIVASEPTQRLLLRELDTGRWSRVVLVWPSQRGKTLIGIILPWLHAICDLRDSVSYMMPNLDKLSQNWEGKIKPAINGAGFGDWLPIKGPGSKGGRPAALPMRDPSTGRVAGRTYFMALGGGGRETSTSSVTTRIVCVDEADDAESAGQLELAFRRSAHYGANGRAYVCSTVNTQGDRQTHPVLDLAAQGTLSRIHHRCPHCGDFAPIPRDRLVGTALVCLVCSAQWSAADQVAALNAAELRHAQEGDGQTLSLICAGPDFHMGGGLAEICRQRDRAEAAQALGDQSLMTTYLNKVWCEHHDTTNRDDTGATTVPTRNRLAALSSRSGYSLAVDRRDEDGDSIHLAEIPKWAEHITVAGDVQRGGDRAPGRIYFLPLARGQGKGAIVGWGHVRASPIGRQPTRAELHAALDRLDGLLRDWSPAAAIVARGLDVGDQQDELLPWIRAHRDWRAIKGTAPLKATAPGDRPGWIYRRQQEAGWILWLIETRSALRVVHGELLTESCLLPRGIDRESSLIRHMCASVEYAPDKWSEKPKDRIHHPEWQSRDDLGQCASYARALAYDWESRALAAKPQRKYGNLGSL